MMKMKLLMRRILMTSLLRAFLLRRTMSRKKMKMMMKMSKTRLCGSGWEVCRSRLIIERFGMWVKGYFIVVVGVILYIRFE